MPFQRVAAFFRVVGPFDFRSSPEKIMYLPRIPTEGISLHNEAVLPHSRTKPAISVVGLGYVGVVSTACLAKLGHKVIGVDICDHKLRQLANGEAPIHEPGLADLLSDGLEAELIEASSDIMTSVHCSEVSFISVNTPSNDEGRCDVSAIQSVARAIGTALRSKKDYHLIVMRCSVPPGTTAEHFIPVVEEHSGKREGIGFGVCFNPEFLRESTAIADFEAPPKTVIGASHRKAADKLASLLAPIDAEPIITDIATAEMVKYVDNVWHAAKVCFGNEIGRVCNAVGVDGWEVISHFSQDTVLNISPHYLKPGFAYGGSCLPKEVRAMKSLGTYLDVSLPLIDSLAKSNKAQIELALKLVRETGSKAVGICGITFKPDTCDLRESPILDLAGRLLDEGIEVYVNDPIYDCPSKMAAQVKQLKAHYPSYADIVERLMFRLQPDLDIMMARTDTLIAAHGSNHWHKQLSGRVERHNVVDIARLFHLRPECRSYFGIGW